MRLLFLVSAVVGFFYLPFAACVEVKLFENYEFGVAKQDIMKDPAIYDCSEDFEPGALCLEGQDFAGENVDIGFRFINNKLVSVILVSEFTQNSHVNFTGALNSRFHLVSMESDSGSIDFIIKSRELNKAEYIKAVSDFERQAFLSGNVKYNFFEKDGVSKVISSVGNAIDLITKINDDARMVST